MRGVRAWVLVGGVLGICIAGRPAVADAAMVTWVFGGALTAAEPGNGLGLAVGDTIAGTATFDDGSVSLSGLAFVAIDSDPAFALTFTVGAHTFVATDDSGYGVGFPLLVFADGALDGFEFLAPFPPPHDALSFDVVGRSLIVTDDADAFREVARGALTDFRRDSPGSVPEPGVIPLFVLAAAAWRGRLAWRPRGAAQRFRGVSPAQRSHSRHSACTPRDRSVR